MGEKERERGSCVTIIFQITMIHTCVHVLKSPNEAVINTLINTTLNTINKQH